jgi:hypothetical protein
VNKTNRRKVMKIYFGFAIADSMLPLMCTIEKSPTSPLSITEFIENGGEIESCLNPSHTPTIEAMKVRFGLDIAIPEKPPQVSLRLGDELIVMSVRGLGRLEGRSEYTKEEIGQATFSFSHYRVKP